MIFFCFQELSDIETNGTNSYSDVVAITMHQCELDLSDSDGPGSEIDHDSE